MPTTSLMQSPPPVWIYRWAWPALGATDLVNTVCAVSNRSMFFPCLQSSSVSQSFNPLVVATNTLRFQWRRGRACARSNTDPTAFIAQWPSWTPDYGPAAGITAGARTCDESVVAVFDIMLSLTSPLAVYTPDTTGWWWVPTRNAATAIPNPEDCPPGAALPLGGFGVCVNNDGAGNAQLEFVCFNGALVTLRIAAPAGSVPDITLWNSVRVLLVSAAAGREAFVSAWVNSVPWIAAQAFDDVTLFRPETVSAPTINFGLDFVQAGSVSDIYQSVGAKFGRTTPSGQPYQTD
jgi:hypothetical protein